MVSVKFRALPIQHKSPTAVEIDLVTVSFHPELDAKILKDRIHPTLKSKSVGEPFNPLDYEARIEVQRSSQSVAHQKAFNFHSNAWDLNLDYSTDSEGFFTDSQQQGKRFLLPAQEPITVGTDCSGIEAPIQALRNIPIQFKQLFSCDNCPQVRKNQAANFKSSIHYDDITTRDNKDAPVCDIYVAGFPCQPFSTAGKQQGFQDAKGRGTIFFNVLDYIKVKRPKVFILENVKGILTLEDGKCVRAILKALRQIPARSNPRSKPERGEKPERGVLNFAYEVHSDILNTRHNGIPQNRERWYCVGIRRDCFLEDADESSFEFPKAIPCPSIESILDEAKAKFEALPSGLSNTARININKAKAKIRSAGKNPDVDSFVVDCDASTAKSRHVHDYSPCITRSRNHGHWLTNRNRRMTINEMFRLQGMDPTQFQVATSKSVLGQHIGNAMSVNVIERVLIRAIKAARLIKIDSIPDRWESGIALKQLQSSRSHPNPSVALAPQGDRILLVDSGASISLTSKKGLTKEERKSVRPHPKPFPIQTANGIVWITEVAYVYVHDLGSWFEMGLLEDTPSVLSLGVLQKQGYDFIWRHGEGNLPELHKDGNIIYTKISHNVPVIANATIPKAAPGESDQPPAESGPVQTVENSSDQPIEESSPVQTVDNSPEALLKLQNSGQPIRLRRNPNIVPRDYSAQPKTPDQIREARRVKAINKRNAKRKTVSCRTCVHNVFTHFPRDPNCVICQQSNTHKAYLRSKAGPEKDQLPEPQAPGDAVTLDHKILNENDASRDNDRIACVVQDKYSYLLQSYASETKDTADTKRALQRFAGPRMQIKHIYSDNSKEIKAACQELGLSHDTSTPHRPATNGIAEKAVHRVKVGTSCALNQSRLSDEWWVEAMMCFCFLRCVIDLLTDGKTPYKKHFEVDYNGPNIPFGAQIEYQPSSQKDKSRVHAMGKQTLPGIFIGYQQHAGSGWSGDLLVADWEDIETKSPSTITVKRFKAPEVTPVKNGESFIFPVAEGDLQQHGKPRIIKRPSTQRPQSSQIEENDDEIARRNSWIPGSENSPEQSAENLRPEDVPDIATSERDFWTCTKQVLIRHHQIPRTKTYVPTEDTCPIPLKYLDIMRKTETNLEHLGESEIRDYWTREGEVELSAPWTGRTIIWILLPDPPPGHRHNNGRITRIQKTTRPDSIWPEDWGRYGPEKQQKEIDDWNRESANRLEERTRRGFLKVEAHDVEEYDRIIGQVIRENNIPAAPAMPVTISANAFPSHHSSFNRPKAIFPCAPAMPDEATPSSSSGSRSHQPRLGSLQNFSEHFYGMVHKPIPLPKAMRIPTARNAVNDEWEKLEGMQAWDVSKVKPRAEVQARAKAEDITIHFGHVMALCHLKNAELAELYQRYKGRIVFRGDDVKDEDGHFAVFSEQGSSAAHMAATKVLDLIARLPHNDGEDADAVGAYTQMFLSEAAELLGLGVLPETWISLPKDRQPKSWEGIEDPVCPLVRNLYGHPLAGLLWEKGCQKKLFKLGFEKVRGWESMYVHKELQLFLGVYVDDFHMAGRKENLKPMWAKIGKVITIDEPVNFHNNTYLGCTQSDVEIPESLIQAKLELFHRIDKEKLNNETQNDPVEQQLRDSPEKSVEGKCDIPEKSEEAKKKTKSQKRAEAKGLPCNGPKAVRGYQHEMRGAAAGCVDRYLELAKVDIKTLTKVGTPCIDDHLLPPGDFETKGRLSPVASKLVLKALYCSRLARPELLWTVNALAREVTKWTVACDKKLHRLISYIHWNKNSVMTSFVGDNAEDCKLMLFCDASFAGDLVGSKSTSGMILVIVGPRTFVPITWFVKKQGAVSHSSAEAEVISLDAGLRLEGIPILDLWDLVISVFDPTNNISTRPKKSQELIPAPLYTTLENILTNVDYVPPSLPKPNERAQLVILEDNDAVIKMCIKQRSPNLRHVARVHRVDLDWLFERIITDPAIKMKYVGTKDQLADIFTKGSFTEAVWKTLCQLIQVGSPYPAKIAHSNTSNS